VKYAADPDPTLTGAVDLVSFSRDLTKESPVEDEVFQVYKSYFAYDSTALNAEVESVDESIAHWRRETVTFDAAYGDERVIAHLYLPRNAAPPYQTVIYNAAAGSTPSSDNPAERAIIEFIPRTGRALVYPVYKGDHERRLREPLSGANTLRDFVIQQVKDFSRTIDYLETRNDINTEKLAYMGTSSGGRYGPIFIAMEGRRLETGVLLWGGMSDRRLPDPIAPINFAPRVTIPVLMINGRHDLARPLETSQKPLFRLLGTPEQDKRHVVIDGGHVTPMGPVIRETLDWLDRYLGPVQRQTGPVREEVRAQR
jgi:pimeloyl-ACP methyl ester carboxylesterase